jgi:opine dehydrogenase
LLRDAQGSRNVPISTFTDDLGTAMRGAALVLIPLPATAQASLAAKVAPLLEDRQVVYLPPGTFGSYLFARAAHEVGNDARVAFAETGTLPWLTRKHSEEQVSISVRATRLPTGVFPAVRKDMALKVIARAFPAIEPLGDALDGALMNAGAIIHPPLILMNAGPLEHFESWDIHNEGTQPAIRRVTDALDAERIAVREALGYGAPHFPLADHYDDSRDEWMYGNSSHEKLTDSGDWREDIDLIHHRYMQEDTRLGLSLIVSLGRWVGIPTPVAAGLLALASAVAGEDFYKTGRTLENLNLYGLDQGDMKTLLHNGFAS